MVDTKEAFKLESTGALTVGTGKDQWDAPFKGQIVGAYAVVKTAPTGATILLDINKNGTTVYTNQSKRPTIAVSALNSGTGTTAVSNDPSTDSWDVQEAGGYTQPSPSQGSRTSSLTPDVVDFVAGDVIALDIDQVGSLVAGADLDVTIQFIQQ